MEYECMINNSGDGFCFTFCTVEGFGIAEAVGE